MISEAVNHFKSGDIVIFPTDTIYGVGCAISNEQSIKKLRNLRKDPANKPTLILVANNKQAFKYGYFDKNARRLSKRFWPGPLTISVKAKETVPKMIQGPKGTIAIRLPNQPPLLKIIEKLGEPILAPSANFHYQEPPADFAQIDKKLLSLVDYAIDTANLDNSLPMMKKPSTLVDLTTKPCKIIRSGYIPEGKIKEALGGAEG